MKRESILLISMIALCIVLGFISLRLNLKSFEPEHEHFYEPQPTRERERFFQFSPTEEYVLDTKKDLWPAEFNAKNPPAPTSIPFLYNRLLKSTRGPELTTFEIMELRQWSVLANADHQSALEKILLEGVENEKSFQKVLNFGSTRAEACSLRNQDRAFRLLQIGRFVAEARNFLENCNPQSPSVRMFAIREALSVGAEKPLKELAIELQNLMSSLTDPDSFSRWYALELFQLVHILRNQEGRDSQ